MLVGATSRARLCGQLLKWCAERYKDTTPTMMGYLATLRGQDWLLKGTSGAALTFGRLAASWLKWHQGRFLGTRLGFPIP
jgi:hypothetical protein